MTTVQRFVLPNQFAVDATGVPYAGAQLYFYVSGSSAPQLTFQDPANTVPNPNPVIADSAGRFGNIFLGPNAYKVVLLDQFGDQIWSFDPVQDLSGLLASGAGADQIGYTPNYTGATETTVSAFLDYIVRPATFIQPTDAGDDALSIQRAISATATLGLPVDLGGRTYTLKTGITVDVSKTHLVGHGARLNAAAVTSGPVLTITSSATDPNIGAALHGAHPLEGFWIYGPDGVANPSSQGIKLVPGTMNGLPFIHNVTIRDGGTVGFNQAIYAKDGCFDLKVERFSPVSATGTTCVFGIVFDAGAVNANERNTLSGIQFDNIMTFAVRCLGGGDLDIEDCSFDGLGGMLDIEDGSNVSTTDCHFESGSGSPDTNVMIYVFGENSRWIDTSSNFYIDAVRVFQLGYTDVSSGFGGINLFATAINLGGHAWNFTTLFGGQGRITAHGVSLQQNDTKVGLGFEGNLLRDGVFQDSFSLDDWPTITGTHAFAATGPTSTNTSLEGTVGVSASFGMVSQKYPAMPGQVAAFVLQYKTSGLAAAGSSITLAFNFLDSSGAPVAGSTSATITADSSGWTILPCISQIAAPKGTASVQFVINVPAATSGTANVWISDANVRVYG